MRHRQRLRRTVLALALLVSGVAAAPPNEFQVKAVYLFNFGHFVDWPAGTFASPDTPFVIGIAGGDPFGGALDEVVKGESLGTHPFAVRRFRDGDDLSRCQILFISGSEAPRLGDLLDSLRGRSVLTVMDVPGAAERGAVIALVNDNNRIRMRINLAAAKAANLVISSKLLRPAEVIGKED